MTVYADPRVASLALFGKRSAELDKQIARSQQESRGVFLNQYFEERRQKVYHSYTRGEIARGLQSVVNYTDNIWREDKIRYVDGLDEMQNAPDAMLRWIMANPNVRTLYHDNRIEGFDERYIDAAPGQVGKHHHDYLFMTSGMVIKEGDRRIVRHTSSSVKEDYNLSFREKCTIALTNLNFDKLINQGLEDPTSEWNGMIG